MGQEGRALSQLKSRSTADTPAPAKDAVAAAPHADTLSSVPRLTSVDNSTAPVTTFWYACAAQQVWEYSLNYLRVSPMLASSQCIASNNFALWHADAMHRMQTNQATHAPEPRSLDRRAC